MSWMWSVTKQFLRCFLRKDPFYAPLIPNQETESASECAVQCLLLEEKMAGLWGDDVPADVCDLSEAEQQSPGSPSENTEHVR